MISLLLNTFANEQEIKYHRPIYNEIVEKINPKIYNKIILSNNIIISPFIKSTYYFYDSSNYLIFKLNISSIYNIDDIMIIILIL